MRAAVPAIVRFETSASAGTGPELAGKGWRVQHRSMTNYHTVELGPHQAATRLRTELGQAGNLLETGHQDEALDRYVAALGLALQLGPAATQQALSATVDGARRLALEGEPSALCTMGPAIVDLVSQVMGAEVLDRSPVGQAWALVASDIGSLIGQVGLALDLPPESRAGMMDHARTRAVLLDDATAAAFRLGDWIEALAGADLSRGHSRAGT